MSIIHKELCPNCIDLREITEKKTIIREEEIYLVEKVVRYCQSCNQELTNSINLRFKHKMG
jgi:hypothetical protein